MTRRLYLTNRSKRDLKRLDPDVRERVVASLRQFARTGEGDLKMLKGYERKWRLRIGDWRAILNFAPGDEEMDVETILHRSRVYRAREESPAWGDPDENARIKDLRFDEDTMTVLFDQGVERTLPLALYPRLLNATPEERGNWELLGGGIGIHWPDVDEDLSVEGMLRGARSPEARTRA